LIVKLKPLAFISPLLDKTVIMALFSRSSMNNYPLELILIILIRIVDIGLLVRVFLLQEALLGVVEHVQDVRELVVVVHFESHHLVEVELETSQGEHQDLGQALDTGSLEGVYFLVALLTEVSVVSFQLVSFDEIVKAFIDALFVLNHQRDRQQGL
jgi:hypothetical protein